MSEIASFKDVIKLWDSQEALASEMGVNLPAVRKWWQRDSIPAEYWAALLLTERAKEGAVSADLLTALAARESAEARA